jgi:hypothetical protein
MRNLPYPVHKVSCAGWQRNRIVPGADALPRMAPQRLRPENSCQSCHMPQVQEDAPITAVRACFDQVSGSILCGRKLYIEHAGPLSR